MTRWNEGCVKTTFQQGAPNEWRKIEDREILNIHQNFDDKVNLIVVVHGLQLKMPPNSERPRTPIMNPQQKRSMSASQRRVQRENVARICVADDTLHALTASVDEIEITKVALRTSGCKSLSMLVGVGLGLILSLIVASGLDATMHSSQTQTDRLAADNSFLESNPFAMILCYPSLPRATRSHDVNHTAEQEQRNVDHRLVSKAKQQLRNRNLLLIENHENISTALAELEDESFELIPLRDGTSWGTNSDEVKAFLQEADSLDFAERSDCESSLKHIFLELQTNASYVAFPAEARVEWSAGCARR